jgi:hypothetical protein
MTPSCVEEPPVAWPAADVESKPYQGPPRNVETIRKVAWDNSLQPQKYSIFGTHPESKILFLDVNILDSTGRDPYRGDVFIQGSYKTDQLNKELIRCHRRTICCSR